MIFTEPRLCDISVATGMLQNADGHYRKSYRDLTGLYADSEAFDAILAQKADAIAYEVTSYTPGAKTSDIIMGVTRMEPGKVGREYFLTRGHIHANGDRPEVYHTLSGRGVMQMESPEGEVRLVEMGPQQVCYVPPYWIHRSVNIGDDDLVMFFAYPADSGQDYGIIERSGGMRVRIMDDGRGGWVAEDNPAWRNRTPDEVASILNRAEAMA
ncbi:glucose-6-phosphate isomerase [Cereibacter changlensis JA139]|uniref:Glucose-6-phosphate isomerase n=2 Tax=Cereibacter changlensis TaxID=402884 RepID=A0A2T4JT57_9RHOB|nr:glucose-6-phosphate isomerase [Cereibacter changlensis]PTE20953.1 glucose-6-phosphate isomerase [Cereibacter changlensis JA139]PZX56158.1 glucose-6-phosphate isomerase [Cereibacter changlensis]